MKQNTNYQILSIFLIAIFSLVAMEKWTKFGGILPYQMENLRVIFTNNTFLSYTYISYDHYETTMIFQTTQWDE